jgi:hypothetical protein
MKDDEGVTQITRETIVQLLSEDDVVDASVARVAPRLSAGDEYLDLEHLEDGVRRSSGMTAAMDHLLPKKAVRGETWARILAHLPAVPTARTRRDPPTGSRGART